MKGFKKMGFTTSADPGHRGSVSVKSYTRSPPVRRFAEGGAVVKRTQPVTDFDKSHGGKGPLRTGYNKGGRCKY